MRDDDRLRRWIDDQEIKDLIVRLAMAGDEGTPADYAACFTADARWAMQPLAGAEIVFKDRANRDEIVAGLVERRAAATGGPGSHMRHVIFMTRVDLDGDVASARSYFGYCRALDVEPKLAMFGIYEDRLRRTAEGWRLTSRDIGPA